MSWSVPLGIMFGLFLWEQAGVFGFSWLAIRLKLATVPAGSNGRQFYRVAVLTGIGVAMSLFIDSLAVEDALAYQYADTLAVLIGSFLSWIICKNGFVVGFIL